MGIISAIIIGLFILIGIGLYTGAISFDTAWGMGMNVALLAIIFVGVIIVGIIGIVTALAAG